MVERGKEEKRNFKKKERNKRWQKNKNDILEKETIKEQKYWSKLKGPNLKSKEQRYKPSNRGQKTD